MVTITDLERRMAAHTLLGLGTWDQRRRIAVRIVAGATRLDELDPTWFERVLEHVEDLAMGDSCNCVLGLAFAHVSDDQSGYMSGCEMLGIQPYGASEAPGRLGFFTTSVDYMLTEVINDDLATHDDDDDRVHPWLVAWDVLGLAWEEYLGLRHEEEMADAG